MSEYEVMKNEYEEIEKISKSTKIFSWILIFLFILTILIGLNTVFSTIGSNTTDSNNFEINQDYQDYQDQSLF